MPDYSTAPDDAPSQAVWAFYALAPGDSVSVPDYQRTLSVVETNFDSTTPTVKAEFEVGPPGPTKHLMHLGGDTIRLWAGRYKRGDFRFIDATYDATGSRRFGFDAETDGVTEHINSGDTIYVQYGRPPESDYVAQSNQSTVMGSPTHCSKLGAVGVDAGDKVLLFCDEGDLYVYDGESVSETNGRWDEIWAVRFLSDDTHD